MTQVTDTLVFKELKKNIKKDFSTLKRIKVAILGDSATQFLNQALKGFGFTENINFEIYEADYDQIERQAFDLTSELYRFEPEFIVIFKSTQKFIKKFYQTSLQQQSTFADTYLDDISNLCNTINNNTSSKIILFNFAECNDSVFGNYANKTSYSLLFQTRKVNYKLMVLSQEIKNLSILDYSLLHSQYGQFFSFDTKVYYTADMVLSIDMLPVIAKNITDIINAVTGVFKKCLILDLDNTMWGGVIGDDGIENIQIGDLGIGKAFTEFQRWVKQLKERGIILAVCSKNNLETAQEPFRSHPDMVLKLDDIALFVANWNNKADNINYIKNVLNIGFDSMVFLDDNPFERNIVRTNIPEVSVPELPEDPTLYLSYLQELNLFETASFSDEDTQRTQQYQEESSRTIAHQNFANEDDFLKSLDMVSEVKPFDNFNTPRVAQLSQRSNQFNLRTVRYTEDDISKLSKSTDCYTLSFTLRDKYGDNGLICVVVLQKQDNALFIESWFMSCRVLKRGMENFTLNQIIQIAKQQGLSMICGEYLPTSKNSMVKDHYKNLGFIQNDTLWHLDVNSYNEKQCFITPNFN